MGAARDKLPRLRSGEREGRRLATGAAPAAYAFVTNCSSELAAVAVERAGLRPKFTLSAEEAGWFKPRREAYALAVERLGLAATQVQFVAGAAYDAIGASNAGLSTTLVARRPLLEPLPEEVRVVGSLTEALEGMERGPA